MNIIRYAQAFRFGRAVSALAALVAPLAPLVPLVRLVPLVPLVTMLAVCSQASEFQGTHRIEGIVKDQAGAPVSSAEVILAGKAGSTKQITDSEGRFAFESVQDESGTIVVRATGFDSAERRWSAADRALSTFDIVLVPAPLSSEITVTAERTETRVSDTAASVTVLSTEDLATTAAHYTDLKTRPTIAVGEWLAPENVVSIKRKRKRRATA